MDYCSILTAILAIMIGLPVVRLSARFSSGMKKAPRQPILEDIVVAQARGLPYAHQKCGQYSCPCGFKANPNASNVECVGLDCDWHDRDTCCSGDFEAGDYPSCYGVSIANGPSGLFSPGKELRPEWPRLPNEQGDYLPITSPMMQEFAMDAYRGCAEASKCEQADGRMECSQCITKKCKGMDPVTKRPKAAPWYPNKLADAPEAFIHSYTCDSCYLTDKNGRGNGHPGCSGTSDWLEECDHDTLGWMSHDGRACSAFRTDMLIPQLFGNDSLKAEVKRNCCATWKCANNRDCKVSEPTTTTTTLPPSNLTFCPYDDGCHDAFMEGSRCPCHQFVAQVMGYKPWESDEVERKVRANCCGAVAIYEKQAKAAKEKTAVLQSKRAKDKSVLHHDAPVKHLRASFATIEV